MPRNGSGTAVLPNADYTAGTVIESAKVVADLDDIESMLTASIAADGQTPTTAAIPFAAGVQTDTVAEKTAGTGVTIDGVLVKDGGVTLTTALPVGSGGTGGATAGSARTNLGLAIDTNVQAYNASLSDIASLTPASNAFMIGTGSNWTTGSGSTARASLGLTIGTNVQAYSARLAEIAALTPTDSNIVVGNGSGWVAESGATLRASIGLGTAATVNVGTSGATIPLLSGNNVFSGAVNFRPATDQNMQIYAGSGAININILNDAFNAYTDLNVYADQIQMIITSLGIGGVSPGEELYVSDGCKFSGRVGIGKGRHTSIELDVESDTDGAGVARFVQPGGTATGVIVQMGHAAAANTAYTFFEAYSNGIGGDREAYIRGDGNAFCDGTWSGGGADFAEYFEWADGNPDAEDRRGISVTLDGGLIREAKDGEAPIGIVSAAPTITGGGAPMRWHGKYRRDAYGAYALDKDGYRVMTDEYDGRRSTEYIPRAERPEWAPVGIVGRVRMRKDQVTAPSWVKIADITDDIEEWLVR